MSDPEIKLKDLLNIDPSDYGKYTLCLNELVYDGSDWVPTEALLSTKRARLMHHISHKTNAGRKSSFRRIDTPFCLQFLKIKEPDEWLFLGIFENRGEKPPTDTGVVSYDLAPSKQFSQYKERLIVRHKKHQGDKQAKIPMQNIENMEVIEIKKTNYGDKGNTCPEYNNVSLSFAQLEATITKSLPAWQEPLTRVNGIYVIADKKTGRLYVGSTYGYNGIWQRWSKYVETGGHGGDKELKALLKDDPSYASHFQFSILEVFFNPQHWQDDQFILGREAYWKKILLTSVKYGGLNRN